MVSSIGKMWMPLEDVALTCVPINSDIQLPENTAAPLSIIGRFELDAVMPGVKDHAPLKCNGCGLCVDTCIFKHIEVKNGKAVISTSARAAAPAFMEECVKRISGMVDVT